jgi:hypothetical protein
LVSQYIDADHAFPAVASDDDGNFFVVWHGSDAVTDWTAIFGRPYAADGTALGDTFRVNTFDTFKQEEPAIDMAGNGRALVCWDDHRQEIVVSDTDKLGVYGQWLDINSP